MDKGKDKDDKDIESIERQLKEQEDIMRMLVHDLKGPLNEIISNIDIVINSDSLRDIDRECLDTALTGCNTLRRMIMDILDIGKIEEGMPVLRLSCVNMLEPVNRAISGIKGLSMQKNLKISKEVMGTERDITLDEGLIERVIANLLFNAVEHTGESGEIKITIDYSDSISCKISVADTGVGIPTNMLEKVFDKFVQIEYGGIYKRYGTGLGLTFCRMAVERHGGSIGVKSKEGKGSTFFFTLPYLPKNL